MAYPDVRTKSRRLVPALAGLVAASLAAGCAPKADSSSRLDVTVNADAALALDQVAITFSGGGRQDYSQTFDVMAAAGTPPAVPPVVWQVVVPSVTSTFVAEVQVRGRKAGSDVVTLKADVGITPASRVAVTLSLTAACRNVTCADPLTCINGTCQQRPSFGQVDAGAGMDAPVGSDAGQDARGSDAADAGADRGDAGNVKGQQGDPCGTGNDCANGICVEGVCCESTCTDLCHSCLNTLTGSMPNGTCAPIVSGKDDPQSRCGTAAQPTSCGVTGHCDGKGACEKYGSTTICMAAACAGGSYTPAATCDSAGNCSPVTPQDCKGFTCSPSGGCATTCTTDNDCPNGYCATSTCAAKKIDGSSCNGNNECVHGACVGNICCENACGGKCMSCAAAETGQASGLCKPISAGGGSHSMCAVDATACGHDGTCDGQGGCRYKASSTVCRAASCTGGSATPQANCDGMGNCPTATTQPCAPFLCGTTACLGTCTSNTQCVAGAACVNNSCMMCGTGLSVCPNACVNLTSTDASCGSCGHSCQGGGCASSACQPKGLVNQPISTYNVVAALLGGDGNIYVLVNTDVGGFAPFDLWQIPISGSGMNKRVCMGVPSTVTYIAVSGTSVFWIQPTAATNGFDVVSSPIATCNPASPSKTIPSRSFGTDYVADGPFFDPTASELIWFEQDSSAVNNKRLMRATTAGANVRMITMFNYGGSYLPAFFAPMQGPPTRLFWTEDRGSNTHALLYVNTSLSGSTPVTVTSMATGFPLLSPSDLVMANDTNVLWDGYIAPLPAGISGGGPPPAFSASIFHGTIDATTFYGTLSSASGNVVKCTIASCSPMTLVTGQSAASIFLQDATTVYWINEVLGISPTDPSSVSATKLAK
jgi:hypothetical protein